MKETVIAEEVEVGTFLRLGRIGGVQSNPEVLWLERAKEGIEGVVFHLGNIVAAVAEQEGEVGNFGKRGFHIKAGLKVVQAEVFRYSGCPFRCLPVLAVPPSLRKKESSRRRLRS